MITCSCGYQNQDTETVCAMCRAPLKRVSSAEKTEERKEQWSFTNVGAVRQTAGVNPLKAEVEQKNSKLNIFLILFALIVLAGVGCAVYFIFIRK